MSDATAALRPAWARLIAGRRASPTAAPVSPRLKPTIQSSCPTLNDVDRQDFSATVGEIQCSENVGSGAAWERWLFVHREELRKAKLREAELVIKLDNEKRLRVEEREDRSKREK